MKAFSSFSTKQSKTRHLHIEKDKATDFQLFLVVNGVSAKPQGDILRDRSEGLLAWGCHVYFSTEEHENVEL